MTVGQICREMSRREFELWYHYWALTQFDLHTERQISALAASAIYNVHRKKGRRAISPAELVPDFEGQRFRRKQTPRDMLALVRQLTIMRGGKIIGGKSNEDSNGNR